MHSLYTAETQSFMTVLLWFGCDYVTKLAVAFSLFFRSYPMSALAEIVGGVVLGLVVVCALALFTPI